MSQKFKKLVHQRNQELKNKSKGGHLGELDTPKVNETNQVDTIETLAEIEEQQDTGPITGVVVVADTQMIEMGQEVVVVEEVEEVLVGEVLEDDLSERGAALAEALDIATHEIIVVKRVSTNLLYGAPQEWNFFKPLDDAKLAELMITIQNSGLMSPITIWQNPSEDGSFMILSGHNRVRAYQELYKLTGDPKYLSIESIIKTKDEITEDEAKRIIIISNYVSRTLTTKEIIKSVIALYKTYRYVKGGGYAKIAKSLNLSEDTVYDYAQLGNLIDVFIDLIDNKRIHLKNGVRISRLNAEVQSWLYDTYCDMFLNTLTKKELNNKLKRIKSKTTQADLEIIMLECANANEVTYTKLTLDIPSNYYEECMEMIQLWLEEKEKEAEKTIA